MLKSILIIFLFLTLLFVIRDKPQKILHNSYISSEESEKNLVEYINVYRVNLGLNILKTEDSLCDFALRRSKEIITDWSHNGFYVSPPNFTKRGENLAKCFTKDQDVLEAWLDSRTHKQVIEGEYDKICIGKVVTEKCEFVALEVAK